MKQASPIKVAVLDDEPQMRKALRRLLGSHGFCVEDYHCGSDFLAALATHPVGCLILDLHMPEVNGYDVLAEFQTRKIKPPIVVLTGHDEPGAAAHARSLGAFCYLTKPVDESALLAAILSAIETHVPLPS